MPLTRIQIPIPHMIDAIINARNTSVFQTLEIKTGSSVFGVLSSIILSHEKIPTAESIAPIIILGNPIVNSTQYFPIKQIINGVCKCIT